MTKIVPQKILRCPKCYSIFMNEKQFNKHITSDFKIGDIVVELYDGNEATYDFYEIKRIEGCRIYSKYLLNEKNEELSCDLIRKPTKKDIKLFIRIASEQIQDKYDDLENLKEKINLLKGMK
ncbi:MAG: hypothetical protein AABY32_04035 [Nanoarchaeota archaeon]